MSQILEQSDIDALLAAVDQGDIAEETTPGQLFSRHRREEDEIEIRPYDFKRPERVSKEQMRSLHTLHEAFARVFGAALTGFLRSIVEVRVASAEQMTYAEFIASLPNPTAFSLIHPDELDGMMCLEVSPLIVYPIIDRLMGGTNQELFIPQRPMTGIEGQLISVILNRAMNALSEAWASIREMKFELGELESNPQLVQIVPPNEVAIVIGFEIKMSSRAGTMNLCIPFNVIEPMMQELNAQSWFNTKRARGDDMFSRRVIENLTAAPLDLSGVLAETTITLEELTNLAPGDVIMTEKPASKPVVLCVEGERKFIANIGQHRGSRALKIIRPYTAKDRV
ncbi:MAG: flagellar motor switch protein FliM [Phycisphaerales bacterium]